MTNKIKQVIFTSYGKPEVLQIITAEKPQARSGEVLIKVIAIGVNYADILRRENRYFMPTPLPFILGSEAVGIIEEVGIDVPAPYVKGSRILAILPQAGAYATYVTASYRFCIPLHPAIEDLTATAIFVQGTTAHLMISQMAGDLTGKTVLINAAAGGVGSILVQLAKLQGAIVIGAASTDDKLKMASSMGADAVVNYTHSNWSEQVKAFNGGKGVDLIFEMAGGDIYNESLKCLEKGGHMIVYGCASGVQGSIHPEYFVDQSITQSGFNLAYFIQQKPELWQDSLNQIIHLLANGIIRIETPKTFALEEAVLAHRQIEERKTTGKVVLLT